MKKPTAYATALLIAISTCATNAQDKKKEETTKKTEAKAEGESKEKKADKEITIKAETLTYDTSEFTVHAGQTVKLTLESTSTLPKAAGGHNLVILAKGTDVAKFATAAMTAQPNDYIPQDAASKAKILAYTKLLDMKEKDTITFTAPAEGTYDYICTFPGHFAVMKGKMKVKPAKGDKGKEDKAKTDGAKKEADEKKSK